MQFPKHQIAKINEALKIIPKEYRTRYKSNLLKSKLTHLPLVDHLSSTFALKQVKNTFDKTTHLVEKLYFQEERRQYNVEKTNMKALICKILTHLEESMIRAL